MNEGEPQAAVVIERYVRAPPEVVFGYLTDPLRWIQWQGTEADIDPVPGGIFKVNIRGDGFASGKFIEIVPNRRVVFTWGFEHEGNPLRPGSSLVIIDLLPQREGTLMTLTHRDLPSGFEAVGRGWSHYLDRLVAVSEGGDPGVDPNLASAK